MNLFTFILGVVLLPKVYTLKCHDCSTENCTIKECPEGTQCGAVRFASLADGKYFQDVSMKTCVTPAQCTEGSISFGPLRTIITSKCCTTELCNTEDAPEPGKSIPNGNKCFRCEGQQCTATINCEGIEDRCITTTVTYAGLKMTAKGCASKSMCLPSNRLTLDDFGEVSSCCKGNYCNSASSMSVGLMLLVLSSVSLILLS